MLLTNLKIFTMNDNNVIIEHGYILTENDKLIAVGSMDSLEDEIEDSLDMNGLCVYPGFVDAHTHLGVFGETDQQADGNEDTDPITPQLRVIDGIDTGNRYFSEACRAGVTTVLVSPGSTNPIAGQIAAIKTFDGESDPFNHQSVDDLVIRATAAIKFSLGENPKSTYSDKDQMPVTRMAVAALIRETLEKARRYEEQYSLYEKDKSKYDEPEYDQKLESLRPLIRREIPAHFHAHTADDIFTALRISKEFNLRTVIVHATEGHKITGGLKDKVEGVLSGPILTDISKSELRGMAEYSASVMSKKGIPTAIITDHPETPIGYLTFCAAAAVRGGMDRYQALRAITIVPAEICGISDRVGSVETGKDADLVFFCGDPLDVTRPPEFVMLSGRLLHLSDDNDNCNIT